MSGRITLFRPVGDVELALVAASGRLAFPPRLPEQPIFYPMMNLEYPVQIARDGNSRHEPSGFGHVLAFDLADEVTGRWPQIAGGRVHEELWAPAEDLDAFNEMIVGPIRIVATYRDGAPVEEAQ